MMAILIVGLPGSGKTYLAEHEYVSVGYHLIDDPKKPSDIQDGIAMAHYEGSVGVVVTDPNLTQPGNVNRAIKKLHNLGCSAVSVMYFENDWRKAERNLLWREQETLEHRGFINVRHFSQLYIIPEGLAPIPIYQRTEL